MDYFEDGIWTGGTYQSRNELRAQAERLYEQMEAEREKRDEIRFELEQTEALLDRLRGMLNEVEELLA